MLRTRAQAVFIAGHQGMVGSAILRRLSTLGYERLITRSRRELDLTRQVEVEDFLADEKVDLVYLAAAKVGGIYANDHYPADFIYENLAIEGNVIHAAHKAGIQNLLFLGSSCIYPRLAPQPMSEESLLTGELEPTNEPYAIAKIAGIKLCESYNRQYDRDYRSVMPTNLYGPGDNFHPEESHVIPSLLRRFHAALQENAPEVVVWGTGNAMREFLHVDDMADACVHVMETERRAYGHFTLPMLSHINIGTGKDCTIRQLSELIAETVGYQGRVVFDTSRPDGAPRKLLDVSRIHRLGWKARIGLEEGLRDTYRWFLARHHDARTEGSSR